LNSDGSVDNSFASTLNGFNASILSIVVQSDGKILFGGWVYYFNTNSYKYLIRLNQDGTTDGTFTASGIGGDVNSIGVQSDGKIIVAGNFTKGIIRLNTNGSIDNTFTVGSGANNGVNNLAIQSDGRILIAGSFTSFNSVSSNRIVRLNTDGSIDNSFIIGTGLNADIESIAIQTDGKILIAGSFTLYNGGAVRNTFRVNSDGSIDNTYSPLYGASWSYGGGSYILSLISLLSNGDILATGYFEISNGISSLVRFKSDGSQDDSFKTSSTTPNTEINNIILEPDGKILVEGNFTFFNGLANGLARLNVDGSFDSTFNIGSGANNINKYIAIQSDGKILVYGSFTIFNGVGKNYLVRLNNDGSIDNSFNIGTGPDAGLSSITIQNDGKILIAGIFTSFNGTSVNKIVRLNSDGSVDNTFNLGNGYTSLYSNFLRVQKDGKILITAGFLNGVGVNGLGRLNSNGSLDNTFSINRYYLGFDNYSSIRSIEIQDDDKILVGGAYFKSPYPQGLVRLYPDGSMDSTFNIGYGPGGGSVKAISIQPDNKIIIGGDFCSFNGISKDNLVRLNPDGTLDNSFSTTLSPNDAVNSIAVERNGNILIAGAFWQYKFMPFNRIARLRGDSIQPEINIRSGTTSIFSGDSFDFGNLVSGASGSPVIFTIENTGISDLTLGGNPKVDIAGTNSSDFIIDQSAISSPLPASSSTTFSIAFNPSGIGARSASVTISNDDADEGSYLINLTGTGTSSTTRIANGNAGSDTYTVYPSPFANQALVKVNSDLQVSISLKVTDTKGSSVFTSDDYSTNEEISLGSEFAPGVYFVQLIYQSRIQMIRIIKI
jgi:uncharacterized delta-60 repeat protein